MILCIATNIYWTLYASIRDIKGEYSPGRNIANYIKEHGLYHALIESVWVGNDVNQISFEDSTDINTYAQYTSTLVNAYFNHNIIANFNDGRDDEAYMLIKSATNTENQTNINYWKTLGIPDVLIGPVNVSMLTDGQVSLSDYTIVHNAEGHYYWKDTILDGNIPIYVKTSELTKYGLKLNTVK